jgi:hypothetical protein
VTLRRTAVVVGLAVLAGACGVPADRNASVTDDADVPYDLLSPTTTTLLAGEPVGGETTICLEIDGLLLSLGRDRDGDPPLDDDLALISAGPTEGEASLGVRNVLEGGDPVLEVRRTRDLVEVELSDEFVDLPANQQLLAVAQITCTLTSQPGIARVSFRLDERELEVPLQGGELVGRPVTRTDYADLIAN